MKRLTPFITSSKRFAVAVFAVFFAGAPLVSEADDLPRFIPGGVFRIVRSSIATTVLGGPFKDLKSCRDSLVPGQLCEMGAVTNNMVFRFHGSDCSPYSCMPDQLFLVEAGCDHEANYWNKANTDHGRAPAYVCDKLSISTYSGASQ